MNMWHMFCITEGVYRYYKGWKRSSWTAEYKEMCGWPSDTMISKICLYSVCLIILTEFVHKRFVMGVRENKKMCVYGTLLTWPVCCRYVFGLLIDWMVVTLKPYVYTLRNCESCEILGFPWLCCWGFRIVGLFWVAGLLISIVSKTVRSFGVSQISNPATQYNNPEDWIS